MYECMFGPFLYIRCAHESVDILQCIYLCFHLKAACPSVLMMSRHGVLLLCAFLFASVVEKTHIPANHTVSWKYTPWTSSALSQATYMCCIVLVTGPPPQAGSAGRDSTPSRCLSFFT